MFKYNSPLFKKYQNVCNQYLQTFCQKHGLDFGDHFWVSDMPGTIAYVGDYYVSMENIILDIEEEIPESEFFEWYDWTLKDGHNWTYKTWLMNKDPETKKTQEKTLSDLQKDIENFKKFLDDDYHPF